MPAFASVISQQGKKEPLVKKLISMFALCAFLGLAVSSAFAEKKEAPKAEGKEVTVKGTATCAKCGLKETKSCQNAIQVKEGDKTVTYYLAENETSKKFHGEVCQTTKEGVSVTGTVEEKDGKKVITAKKID
jgi:hypothetical protein